MLRRGALACAAALLGLTGCSTDADGRAYASPSSSPRATLSPGYPTPWMSAATVRWRNRAAGHRGRAFPPVRRQGRQWTGDPRRYEQACGADFLIDGDTPDLDQPLAGRAGADGGATYYQWLQADPGRWGAFNAWLRDPAVVHALADDPSYSTDMTQNVGDSSACRDPSAAGS